jgi:ribonuclease P protein component
VLSAEHRLRSSAEFTQVVRRGRRAGRPTLTAHLLLTASGQPARAGLVVSKAVGGSVVRHRVSRRLRHVLRERVDALPSGTLLVLRASPAAATAPSSRLGSDLDSTLSKLGLLP